MTFFITLTPVNFFPSLNNSISFRVIVIKNKLALSRAVPYSWTR